MDDVVISRLFFSSLVTALVLVFLGLAIRIEGIYALSSYANLFTYSGIVLLFVSYLLGLIYVYRSSPAGEVTRTPLNSISSLDILFLGISMLVFVLYKDLVLSIATFLILYSIPRLIKQRQS
jgi:hypothetical protein